MANLENIILSLLSVRITVWHLFGTLLSHIFQHVSFESIDLPEFERHEHPRVEWNMCDAGRADVSHPAVSPFNGNVNRSLDLPG